MPNARLPELPSVLVAEVADASIALAGERVAVSHAGSDRDELASIIETERLHAVGELAAGVAHHLNNLMTVVLGNAQCALRRNPPPGVEDKLHAVEKAVLEAAEVIRRLEAFSKRRPTGEHRLLDVNDLVVDALELTRALWQEQAKVRGIAIETRVETAKVPYVTGDAVALREVLLNLILNAIESLPAGGTIGVKTWADAASVRCAVSDDGIGMTAEVRRRALEPFYTTKGLRRRGLGLSVAYGTVHRHGGLLEIDSVEGRGTTITMTLPTLAPSRAAAPVSPEPPTPAGLRILVVDDDATVRAMLREMLASAGHTVVEAASGAEALAEVAVQTFDVVLTDLGMPGMNGWEVVRRVKAEKPALPVVLFTGWGDQRESAELPRPDATLTKPVPCAKLLAALAEVTARAL